MNTRAYFITVVKRFVLQIIIIFQYTLIQWIALEVHSDWLFKIRISFAIHLRATCAGFAPKNILFIEGMKEFKSSFVA